MPAIFQQVVACEALERFLEFFGCSVEMSFDDFCFLPVEKEKEEFYDYLEKRVAPVGTELDADIDWDTVMTPEMRRRDDQYSQAIMAGIMASKWSADASHAFDNEVNPRSRNKLSHTEPYAPWGLLQCLVSHGFIKHSKFQRPLLTEEWSNVHGHPCVGMDAPYELPLDITALLRDSTVTRAHVRSMVGLGWHAPSMGSFVFFLLASLELRSSLQKLPPEILEINDDDGHDAGGASSATGRTRRSSGRHRKSSRSTGISYAGSVPQGAPARKPKFSVGAYFQHQKRLKDVAGIEEDMLEFEWYHGKNK